MKDPAFTQSNEVFVGKLAKLKHDGKGTPKHYDVLDDDMRVKLMALFLSSKILSINRQSKRVII